MPTFMRVLIYSPYGFIIRYYLISYYTAQNIACNRSFCRGLNACTSGTRNDHVSSLNCDRRFRFFKAASHTILLFALENVACFFFNSPQKRVGNALSHKRRDAQI